MDSSFCLTESSLLSFLSEPINNNEVTDSKSVADYKKITIFLYPHTELIAGTESTKMSRLMYTLSHFSPY